MNISRELALKARVKGVPAMTRMYSGYHTVIGTYEQLIAWFRGEGLFVEQLYHKGTKLYTLSGITMEDGLLIHQVSDPNYEMGLHKLFNALLEGLKDKKGVTM